MRKGRRRRMEGAHHLDEVIIRTHWRVGVKDGVGRDTPEHRLDAPLDLLTIKPPITSMVPSRDAFGTISSRRCARRISGSTLLSWNAVMSPAPVTPASTRRLAAWRRESIFFFSEAMGP
jgi:hypothetical protein